MVTPRLSLVPCSTLTFMISWRPFALDLIDKVLEPHRGFVKLIRIRDLDSVNQEVSNLPQVLKLEQSGLAH